MMRAVLSCVLLVSLGAAAGGQTQPSGGAGTAAPAPVSRRVRGLTLTSDSEPRVQITFGRGLKYVGGQSFVLYDVANAEQHFFVDADARGRIRRLYWVQFEGYLPTNTHAYNYQSKNIVNIGGLDFIADAQARKIPPPDTDLSTRPANKISDGDRARSFLASKGYRLASDEALWQRLVHMVDASNRSELMVIYLEDLAAKGLTAADLSEGGRAAGRWDSVSKSLLERARKGMAITRR